MKLLLTSAGITNQSIANALLELTSKPAHETNLVFILTAAIFNDDKSWLIRNMVQFKDMGFRLFDIMDIAAVEKSNWLPRLQQADVICFGGGNEMHLAEILKSRGISEELPELLKTRVYVGISAGSMVASQTTDPKIIKIVYPEEDITDQPADSLGFVDLVFLPHLNDDYFVHVKRECIEPLRQEVSYPIYALDDNSALKIVDGNIRAISEGEYFHLP